MTWNDVLRRDLRSAYRSRLGPAVAILMFLSTFGIIGAMAFLSDPEYPPPMDAAILALGSMLSFVVPLAALLSSYSAIVGERTTGSVRFLLGLPNSRDDAFVGKLLSRTTLVVAPMLVGVLLSAVVVQVSFEEGEFLPVVLLGLMSVVYAVLFVGLGLLASVYADTDNRAVSLSIGVFALLRAGWPAMQWVGLQSIPQEARHPRPEWYFWLGRLNPINAYVKLTATFLEEDYHPLLTRPESGGFRDVGTTSTAATSMEFAAVVVVVTTVAFLLAGFFYFRGRDML